jgi:hypothetical protein
MNINCIHRPLQQLSAEKRSDSFLAISPTTKKKALAKINLKSCLRKSVLLDNKSVNKLARVFEKASKIDQACKQKKAVKFASAAEYAPSPSNTETKYAAIDIQRIARGGWQRLKFRIAWLQHKLDTEDELKKASIRQIEERTQQRKDKFRRQLEREAKKALKRSTQESTLAKESQEIIAFLRKENSKLRQQNEKIFNDGQTLKQDNARLENANESSGECFFTLSDFTKDIEETNETLNTVVPMYKASVEKMKESVEMQQQFCLSEQWIKLAYYKAIGKAVEMMEDGCRDRKLVDEIFGYCLNVEQGEENTTPLPSKLGKFFADECDESASATASSDEEYDDYTVTTMDQIIM